MDDLFTAQELASKLRVRLTTVRRWTRERVIPSIRITEKVTRYDYAKVCAALRERGTREAASEVAHGPQ